MGAAWKVAWVVLMLVGCGPVDVGPDRHDDGVRPPGSERWAEATTPRASTRGNNPAADHTYLVLKLRERRLYLMTGDGRPPQSFPVAVGQKNWETPTGRFRVTDMIENPDFLEIDWHAPERVIKRVAPGGENPLGMRWIGFTSAYGWKIGFHGTPKPELLGQAVSHGCVRLSNYDILKVYDRVKVGTTVIVEP